MKKWPLVFSLLILVPCWCGAQKRIEEIDALVRFCHENGMFNGTLLIAEKGEILYHRSVGLRDFDKNTPLNLNSTFCLGSISKQFTAFAIMLLKHQGKLAYSDTVGQLFPEMPAYMHGITLEQLMQHTSGLRRTHYGEADDLTNDQIYQNLLKTEGDSLLFEPGTDLSYSNSGYMLLAMVIERVSGQGYEEFLTEQVWRPLGMTHTFVMSRENRQRKNRAVGFDGFGTRADFNVLTYGSNGVYSSAEDLFRWAQSLPTDKLLPLKDKAMAWTPAVSTSGVRLEDQTGRHSHHYGYGLFIYKDDLQGIIGHSGAFGGFLNLMTKDLENNREVILLTNNGRLIPILDVGNALHHILRGEPYALPKISIDYELRKKHYDDIDGAIRYYHQLKKNQAATYTFDNEWELNRLGYALMADQRFDDAIKILRLLVSEFPNRPNPHDSLGEAYYLNGQYERSLASYEKALDIDQHYNTEWIRQMIIKNKEQLGQN